MSPSGGSCNRYELANPSDIEKWLRAREGLVESAVILHWLDRLCADPVSIDSQRALGEFGLYGYRTALIDGEDVSADYVVVEATCEVFVRRLIHFSEIGDEDPFA